MIANVTGVQSALITVTPLMETGVRPRNQRCDNRLYRCVLSSMTAIQPLKYCPHTEPTENCAVQPQIRRSLDFSPVLSALISLRGQQRSKSLSKRRKTLVLERRASQYVRQAPQKMNVLKQARSAFHWEGATLAAAPGALR
jgi:hypothetical protein